MSSFDEYRKKLIDKYGSAPKKEKEDEESKPIVGASVWDDPFESKRRDMTAKYGAGVDKSKVKNWFTESESTFKNLSEYYKANDGKWVTNFGGDFAEKLDELINSASSVGFYLRNNKREFSDYDAVSKAYTEYSSVLEQFKKQNSSMAEFYSQFESEDQYNAWYEHYKKQEEYKKLLESDDFDEYVQKGSSVENPTWEKSYAPIDLFGWKPFGDGEEVKNMVTFAANNDSYLLMEGLNSMRSGAPISERSKLLNLINTHMTDEEKSIYNYYIGKGELEKANAYLSDLQDTLTQRHAGLLVDVYEEKAEYLKPFFYMSAGFMSSIEGIKNIDNLILGEESDPTSVGQYAYQIMSSENEGLEKVGSDLAYTIGNMLPSILISVATKSPLAGAAVTGLSTSGNGYKQMRDLGYDEWQSRGYGLLVGASEAGLQYLLGGISKLGGKVSGKAIGNLAAKFDSAIARTAIKLGGNMASEGIEEAIQTILEPAFKALVTGETFEAPEWEDVWYSALLGALSAGVMEGAPTIANTATGSIRAKNIYGTDPKALITEALEIDPENDHAKRMKTKLDSGQNISGYQLNRLVEANEQSLAMQDKTKMTSAAEERLTKLGETGDVKKIAEVLVKQASGEDISIPERRIIKNSKFGQRVANELSPQNIQSGEYTSKWAEGIGTERINTEAYNKALYDSTSREPAVAIATEEDSATKNPTAKENAVEAKFKASTDGKTRIGDLEVSIKEIASVKNGEVTLRLEDGSTVDAMEVEFGSPEETKLYGAVANMNVNAATANAFIKGYDHSIGVDEYALGFREAYRYGEYGFPIKEMTDKGFSASLAESQRMLAYDLGRNDAKFKIAAKQKTVSSLTSETADKKTGKVYYEEGFSAENLTQRQQSSLKGIETLANALGVDFHIFESQVVDGKRQGANGWFDRRDGSIHIDLHAGLNGEGTMLFTASHELTHFIREWSPEKFKVFADSILEEYGNNNVSVEALVSEQIAKAKRNGRDIDYDTAYEEVIADSCEAMLSDGDIVGKIAKIKSKDKSLWKKIRDFITDLVDKIKAAYKGMKPDSVEGRFVSEMLDKAEKLKALWTEALVDASDTYASADKTLFDNGIVIDTNTESASLMSVRDLLNSEQQQQVAQTLADRFGVTVEEAKGWISAETSLASLILNPKYSQYLDYVADSKEEAIKSNSDYPQGTVDFSNICKKRRDFTEVMNRVLRNFPNHVFEATDLAKIRTIMSEEGMEVSCGICYVEDRRQLDSIVAQDFIDSLTLYRKGSKTRPDGKAFNTNQIKALKLIDGDSYVPSIYELVSLEGRNSLKSKNPAMEEAWVKFNNARGMQSVRLLLNDAEYKRQILDYKPTTVKRKNDFGGLRIYSFSDMEMFHLIDIIQVITDSATVGLSIQGYTKVNEYAKAVKDTGEKLNRSLIPKGDLGYHVEDGRIVLDFDTVEGIDVNHPDFFDNIDNPNIGNIVIGINAKQIKAAMTSKFIDQIIPFHTGQSNDVLGEKGIATWVNYKDFQSERDLSTGKKSSHQINIYTEVIQAAEAEGKPITNKVEFVNKFLQVCKENNLEPRFSEFLNVDENGDYIYTEGYHKFLVDFKTFDQNTGEYLPQLPVKPIFDNAYITQLLKDYVKTQQEKDAKFSKAAPKVLDRITNEIVKPKEKLYSDRDAADPTEKVNTLVTHIRKIIENTGGWQVYDVFDYVKENPDLNFIERILGKDTTVKSELETFLAAIDDTKTLHDFSWFMGEAYKRKAMRYGSSGRLSSPYQGAVRTFRNAIQKRINEIMTEKANGTNLGVKNGEVSLDEVKGLFDRLNSNDEIGELAEKVFATAKKLGVNIRFANQTFSKKAGGGDAWGDMIELKTSYFNNTAYTDQRKAQTILHELIHSCTVYVMNANEYFSGDVHYSSDKTRNYELISNAATRLNRIYQEIKGDPDFKGQYGIKNAKEMVAELANPTFVELLKKKTLWEKIVDWICELFGFRTGTSAYDNAMACLDYILDNPEVSEYKAHAARVRDAARRRGEAFGSTVLNDGQVLYSDRYQSADANTDILSMVEKVGKGNFKANDKIDLGIVSDTTAAEIQNITGINVKGFKIAIEARQIEHIIKRHGTNGKADKSMANSTDIAKIGYTLENYDDIRSAGKTRAYKQFRDGNSVWVDTVLYEKEIGSKSYYVVQAVPDTKAKTLYIVTAYIGKKGYKKEASQFIDEKIPDATPKSEIAITSNSIISQSDEFVNRKFSDRDPDSVSNRSLLANALENVARNDVERRKLEEYKSKIALIESEQAKLADLRAKIKELSFAKGKRDTEAIKKLQFEANQSANRINTYDKQLLNLESTKALKDVLEREKQAAYKKAEQRGKEALAAYRERSVQAQRDLMTRYQESRKKGVEGRHRTAMRHKIKDVVSELNKYLLKGTKDKHVPIELQKAVAEALSAVNMDTVGAEERLAKIQEQLQKDPLNKELQETYRRISEQGERMDGKLQALKNAYDDIVNSNDPLISNAHDEVISDTIDSVIKEVGSTPLRDMTLSQLESVYDMYKMVLTTIRNANKAFKAAKSEEISTIANRVMGEINSAGKAKPYRTKVSQAISRFDWNNLKPVYAFERIGSNTFTEVFNNVRAGEDTWAVDISEAKNFSIDQQKKFHYDSWDFKKRYNFTSSSGMHFELSLDQIMSLYAYSKREQARDHLKKGGIVIDETTEVTVKNKLGIPVKFNPTEATAYNISDETLGDIIGKLTTEQRAFVDVMQDYLSITMGEKGNEVSLALYDVKLYKEKNYFPLKSAQQFMAKAKEQQKGEVKIKNSGFSKETVRNANNPIVLTPFMDVWADHVNEMSMYHAFVLPLEDFYRVYNYKTPTSDTTAIESVEMYLQNAFGKGATQYIDQLLKDLNGGARVDPTAGIINKLTGLFKKSAVFASLSVVVQQPAAIARAAAIVDMKHFIGKPLGNYKSTWAEIKKYAPVAIIKEMGYFDTGMGQSTIDWIKDEKTWKDKLDDIVSKAPAIADELSWCSIWNAIKRETLQTHKNLRSNSEEFLKIVGERFTEVITKTQVYDSVLSRSANMRSKDTGMKMATAFMAEPTTSINMLENALIQGKRGNKVYARKAVGSVIASMILNSVLVSFVYAGRDDDEEKTYTEKYISTLAEELIDSFNPLTLIPFVKDIVSIAQGYDVERSDMAVITDIINAWNNLENDNRSVYRKVEDFAGAIAAIFGLPVKNIMRDARGIYNTINSSINGEKTTVAGIGVAVSESVTGKEKSNGQQLYEAILSGDTAHAERVKGRFEDQKAIDSAIRKALRDNDPRIKQAAEARYSGNIAEYMRIAKVIIAEGNFSQDNIVSAINSEITLMKNGGGSSNSTTSNKIKSIYEMSDYYSALVGRDQATAYIVKEDLIKTDVANGKDRDKAEADFNSKFASHIRDLYEAGNISDSTAEDMLVNYGGKSEEEARAKIQYWNFKQQYPDYDLSEESVTKYYTDIEPTGIDVDVYYSYNKQKSKCTGTDSDGDGKADSGSVKSEVLEVIDSLPITDEQKDALYYLNGWAASTIWQAPWH